MGPLTKENIRLKRMVSSEKNEKQFVQKKNPKKARYTVLTYYAFRLSGGDLSRAFNFSSNNGEMDAYNFLSTEDHNSYFNLYTYAYLNSYLRR